MKNFKRLTEIFILLLLFANSIALNAQNNLSDNIFTLPAGTKIQVKMDNEINSKVSSVNDTFTVTVSSPIVIRNIEVLASGSTIEGKITDVKPAVTGKNGELEVSFETLRLPFNVRRNIDADLVNPLVAPKTSTVFKTLAIVGGTAIGAVLGSFADKSRGALLGAGIGAGVGTATVLLKKGKDLRIKANEEFEIILNKEVNLPAKDY